MSDMFCAKCGEPWDAYGVNHGDMSRLEAERFKNGEGCPACGFGGRCPNCNGAGRVSTGCKTCFGNGLVYVRKLASRPSDQWVFDYSPNLRQLDGEPFRRLENGYSRDGTVWHGVALCPDCLAHNPEVGRPCPDCNGSGKLVVDDPEGIFEQAVWSAMESSDEDPIGILHRMVYGDE